MVSNLGPVLITETAAKMCKIGNKFSKFKSTSLNFKASNIIVIRIRILKAKLIAGHSLVGEHGKQCYNITVMDHQSFHPLKANDRRKLFTSFPKSHWR